MIITVKQVINREPHFSRLNAAVTAFNAAAPALGMSGAAGDLGGQLVNGKTEALRGQAVVAILGMAEELHKLANDLTAVVERVAVTKPFDLDPEDEVEGDAVADLRDMLPDLQKVARAHEGF